ncbi:g2013 [Coccomyxa elongata]
MAAAPRFFVSAPRVILYDGVCNLCNSGIRFVARRDISASINFCAVQSSQAQPYLDVCRLTREEVLQQFVFIQGDRFSRASTAALDVAGHLKFPWPLARIFLAVPLPARDAMYNFVAHNRYQLFGKTIKCQVPDRTLLERCLDANELVAAQYLPDEADRKTHGS